MCSANGAAPHHGEGGVSRLVDAETGDEVRPLVVDAATGEPVGARQLKLAKP